MNDAEYLEHVLKQYGHRVYAKYNQPKEGKNVYVGRPSLLGNPFQTAHNKTWEDRANNCISYRNHLFNILMNNLDPEMARQIKALDGCNVICWCSNGTTSTEDGARYCHGHTLLYACDYLHGRL